MPRIDYKQIRSIPFSRVLAHYEVRLQEKNVSGDQKLVGRCPIHTNGHQERGKNHFQTTVRSDSPGLENTFHCFSCGACGSVVDFVILMEKLIDVEDVDWEEVSEARKNKTGWNWVPTGKLKLASRLLHAWETPGPVHSLEEAKNALGCRWGRFLASGGVFSRHLEASTASVVAAALGR